MTVFANALEVSCKAQANQIIAAFPGVCMAPPEAPPTPPGIPIPYPNFGMDGDTDKGTGTVKIGGKTINQKNVSYFTKTTGDEAGTAAKKGVVSSKNTGKSHSQAFSMNVKAEGKNVTRFSDISTNNHGSAPNVLPMPKVGQAGAGGGGDKCQLSFYSPNTCPDGETPHHLIGDAQFRPPGTRQVAKKSGTGTTKKPHDYYPGCDKLSHAKGLCICLQGTVKSTMVPDEEIENLGLDPSVTNLTNTKTPERRLNQQILNDTRENVGRTRTMFPDWPGASPYANTLGEHGRFHEQYDNIIGALGAGNTPANTTTVEESAKTAAAVAAAQHGCDPKAMEDQIIKHYEDMDIPRDTVIRSGIENSSDASTQPALVVLMGVR